MEFGKKELDLTADESPGGESLAGVLDGEPAIGEKEISEAMAILEKYKSAKASLDKRIIDNEEWYKLGHWKQYGNRVMEGKRAPSTGWLFNSIANKHADAMDNYPEPNVLPRTQDDEETARLLSDILPVVLEQADYESVYSDTWWRKLKQGTGVKGIFGPGAAEGLGDHRIRSRISEALLGAGRRGDPGLGQLLLAGAGRQRPSGGPVASARGQGGQQRHHRGAVRQ